MSAAAKFDPGDQARRQALAKVHIAKKDLGLDDDTYRAMLTRITGHASASECTAGQLGKVLDEMKAKGWNAAKPGSGIKAHAASHPSAKKARAMWISLHQLGVVREAGEKALEAFARRQLQVQRLQWADQGLTYKLIEALKAMAVRAGWDQDLTGVGPDNQVRVLKYRLADAQARKLGVLMTPMANLTDRELDAVIRARAEMIWTREGQ
ncbi:MAG: regulatory protein GemA [Caulobacter sp.]|nr:regulatory protein GemA [Caulobacter sp.]